MAGEQEPARVPPRRFILFCERCAKDFVFRLEDVSPFPTLVGKSMSLVGDWQGIPVVTCPQCKYVIEVPGWTP